MRNLFESGWEFCPCLLKDGSVEEREVKFYADGTFYSWQEDMHPDGLGYYQTFYDESMEENPEEWEWKSDDDVVKVLEIPKDIEFELAYDPDEYEE